MPMRLDRSTLTLLQEHKRMDAAPSHASTDAGSNSLGELTKRNVEIIAELERAADSERSATDRLADAISQFVGSMRFVYIHVVWFTVWIAAFTIPFLPERWRIDPFPYTF